MAIVVSQTAGCIITSGEEDAVITANWSLKQLSGSVITCPPGTTTAAIYSQAIRGGVSVGAPIIDLYDCNDNFGRTAPLPPDEYQVWVELTSEAGGAVYARSLSQYIDVIDIDKSFTTEIFNDAGYFQLDWVLVDLATNVPFNCTNDPEVDGVAVGATVAGGTAFVDSEFDCELETGVTKPMLQGTYTVSLEAIDSAGRSLTPQAVNLTNKVIQGPNKVTDLGTVNIPVQ